MTWLRISSFALLFLLPLTACFDPTPPLKLVGSFKVTFSEPPKGGLGTPEKPRKVSSAPESFYIDVQALDKNGKPDKTFKGKLCAYVSTGILVGGFRPVPIENGLKKHILVRTRLSFGRTTIWVSDAKGMDKCANNVDPSDQTRPYISRTGAAPDLYYTDLSIEEVQKTQDKPYYSPLFKKHIQITRGKMVVTAVTNNGFFVTDVDAYNADPNSYHSIFVFTFSAPTLFLEEGVAPKLLQEGDRIKLIKGGIDEFSGHTQVAFPSFVPMWKDPKKQEEVIKLPEKERPKAIELPIGDIWKRASMEHYESALVKVSDAIALPFDPNQDSWQQFRQWPILLVKAKDPKNRPACIDFIRTELHVHADPAKNKGGKYRPCVDSCAKQREQRDKKCTQTNPKEKEECLKTSKDGWFKCFFDCRFNRQSGLFTRIEKQGCEHAILMVISSSTVPSYDPTSSDHVKTTFSMIRGVLQEVRASSFHKLSEDAYPDELSNNGYVIWVRRPSDLVVQK